MKLYIPASYNNSCIIRPPNDTSSYGLYWSSVSFLKTPFFAYLLYISSTGINPYNHYYRDLGLYVRNVKIT